MKKIISKILKLLGGRKKSIIYNYVKDCPNPKYKALLYYKTDPFTAGFIDDYSHTNNWEILEMVRILNRQGFSVDIIDRGIDAEFQPENIYDLFIGNAAGNSGEYYRKYAKILTKATKIFYAAGPNPDISNRLIEERYNFFYQRHPELENKLHMRRTIRTGDQIDAAMANTDYIFCIGNEFSFSTYEKFNKKIFRIFPSSHPQLHFDIKEIKEANKKSFLYFGGGGNIVKGLDLLIEAFAQLPDHHLYICAPHEEEFDHFYLEYLEKSKNIHYIGFVQVGSRQFLDLIAQCPYVILPSCSEGTATSVTTCMRQGLIPVVTAESGIDTGDFGFIIHNIKIEAIVELLKKIGSLPETEIRNRMLNTYRESKKYTQASFSKSFTENLTSVMRERQLT